jgi:hypothetical protein
MRKKARKEGEKGLIYSEYQYGKIDILAQNHLSSL